VPRHSIRELRPLIDRARAPEPDGRRGRLAHRPEARCDSARHRPGRPGPERTHHHGLQGISTLLPVVLRASRSRCACAASASG
jgi:hypothetical protein